MASSVSASAAIARSLLIAFMASIPSRGPPGGGGSAFPLILRELRPARTTRTRTQIGWRRRAHAEPPRPRASQESMGQQPAEPVGDDPPPRALGEHVALELLPAGDPELAQDG